MKLVMDERLKHRLVGLAVILSIGAIFAPAIMKKSNQHFEEKTSISIKLPPKPFMPKVAMPKEATLFKNIKVAHVEIPSINEEFKTISTVAKAEPLSRLNEVKIAEATNKEFVKLAKEIKLPPVQQAKKLAATNTKKAILTKTIAKATISKPVKATTLPSGYVVQLGTFSQQSNALSLVKKLNSRGYAASYNKINSKHGTIFKVTAGRAKPKQEAIILQQQLASVMQIKGFVIPTTGIS